MYSNVIPASHVYHYTVYTSIACGTNLRGCESKNDAVGLHALMSSSTFDGLSLNTNILLNQIYCVIRSTICAVLPISGPSKQCC